MADKKEISYLAGYFPTSGRPVEVEVKADENGTVTHEGKTWVITPNSSWVDKKGKRRIILPEGLATSFDGGTVAGKTILSARQFFLFFKMNLLEQMFKLQNQKPWFKQSSTWIIAGSVALVALILVWMVIEIGGGFDRLKDVILGLDFPSQPGASPSDVGHNTLEPR